MKKLRYFAFVAALALLVAASYAYWNRSTEEHGGDYVIESIDRGVIAATVTATGTVNPVSTVQVGTYVSGPIRAIDVDFNSLVRKGQRVAKIDPAPFQVKVKRAEANLANAEARLEKDRVDLALKKLALERNQELRNRDFISQNDLDTAKSNYDQAVAQITLDEASVRQAKADLEEARINLAYTDITSPVDGVVVSRNVDVGQTVAASFQTPTLFLIAQDLTKMQVDTNVSESDIGAIRNGQTASFTVDAYPEREFTGTVVQVRNAPLTVQNVVTYDVVIGVDNSSLDLKPGMTATVTLTTARRDDVLRLPIRALRFNPHAKSTATPGFQEAAPRASAAAPAVWVVGTDGSPRHVEVQTGLRDEQYAEVLSGDLHPGDQVAVARRRTAERESSRPPGFLPRFR